MIAGGSEAATDDDNTMKFLDVLFRMKLHETALSERATGDLARHCLAKFDDEEATPDCRAIALYTVAAQISAGNPSMLARVPDVCRRLNTRSVLGLPVTDAEEFHCQVVNAVSIVLDAAPETLVDESFGRVMNYLVQRVSCERHKVATVACKFWAKHAGMPANAAIRKHWMGALLPEMSMLIRSLMDQMRYRPEHAEHLQRVVGSRCGAADDRPPPSDVESFANLRNVATVAFEHVARVYPAELVCATFRPLLERRIRSDSWSEKEAAILALAAFTQGAGTPLTMCDLYPTIVPLVLDCYDDPHPLVRSVACLAMPKLVGRRLPGVKDPWSRVLIRTAVATADTCAEVRRTALRALSSLLAYGTPSTGRSGGVSTQTARLIDALDRAGRCDMDPETQCAYFECVSHLVGRASDSLTAADMDRLIPPLVAAWKSQPWNPGVQKTGRSVVEPDLGIVPLSVALGIVATYAKSLYVPFAESVFEKACADIEEIVKSAASNTEDVERDKGVTSHVISCLDLLSANYDGLAAAAAPCANKFHLLKTLHATLIADSFDERVYQSALALLGHVFTYETGPTQPDIGEFLDVIRSRLEAPDAATKTRGNALWALVHAAANRSASEDGLVDLVDRLIAVIKRTDDEPTCIINAAWALTSICASRPTNNTVADVVTRPDVFLHLSGLLRAEFPRPNEKVAIFTNVCRMLAPVINNIPPELWTIFLTAVVDDNQATASNEVGSRDLHVTLKSLLRDIRSTLGSRAWTRALQEMGPSKAMVLRHRYKL